ncbi:MAG: D-alanine--D-alanine ligase [Gemmatimonadaceae bacterium]|nr:D-alanine--D-alanine ligase [Gemmatimonadaceae bacterium]
MNLTVLLGGTSSERDVSLASGLRIASALRDVGHTVACVDPARGEITRAEEDAMRAAGVVQKEPPTREALQAMAERSLLPTIGAMPAIRNADVVFIALHGGEGEDGTVQAILDLAKVTYTGSGHLASALAMDKDLSKRLFRAAGVTTADWLMTGPDAELSAAEVERALGFPVVVKPSKEGSTVGLTVVKQAAQLRGAIVEAARYDDEVMVERFVPGRELTVGVVGGHAMPVGEIIPKHEIYDYECKYTPGMAVEEFPARLSPELTAEAQRLAVLAFRALKLDGCARIDFRMTSDGKLFCLEANTSPGMTGTSLIPQAAAADGMDFSSFCDRIVALAKPTRRGGQ